MIKFFEQREFAIITGGLHGRPRGNVAGVVYGAARTRTGKAVTARELVSPSNPQTPAQVLQRHIFSESLDATKRLSASLWQDDWNRAVGQLPGFQSMMSILLNNTDALEDFNTPSDTPLGDLHFPITFTVVTGAGPTRTIDVAWSNELGSNGTVNDTVEIFCIAKLEQANQVRDAFVQATTAVRATLSQIITCPDAATIYQVGVYFQGAGAAAGLLTPCEWREVASKA